jgi:hypothetical protein
MAVTRWEYKVLCPETWESGTEIQANLNALGREGWELAAAFNESGESLFILKRAVQEKSGKD